MEATPTIKMIIQLEMVLEVSVKEVLTIYRYKICKNTPTLFYLTGMNLRTDRVITKDKTVFRIPCNWMTVFSAPKVTRVRTDYDNGNVITARQRETGIKHKLKLDGLDCMQSKLMPPPFAISEIYYTFQRKFEVNVSNHSRVITRACYFCGYMTSWTLIFIWSLSP